MTTLMKLLSKANIRKYLSFFEFYYYVITRSPKRYNIGRQDSLNHLVILMTPLVMMILSMIVFVPTANGLALASMIVSGIILVLNLIFTSMVNIEAINTERKKNDERRRLEKEEELRRILEEFRRQQFEHEQVRRRIEEEKRRAEQRKRESETNTEQGRLKQLYAVLGINPTTDINVVKKAYRQKAKQCHPDKGGNEQQFINVNRAYEIILKFIESNSNVWLVVMKHMKKLIENVFSLILKLVVALIVSVISFYISVVFIMISIDIVNDISDSYISEKYHTFNIYALEDSKSYVVYNRRVDEDDRYYFVRKLNGGYKKGYIPSGKTLIYYTDKQPKIIVYNVMPEKFNKLYKWSSSKLGAVHSKEYNIYIPEGSLTADFVIDLK